MRHARAVGSEQWRLRRLSAALELPTPAGVVTASAASEPTPPIDADGALAEVAARVSAAGDDSRPPDDSSPRLPPPLTPEPSVIALHGNLDAAAGATLRADVAAIVAATSVVVDLTGVDFIDAAGLHALLGVIRTVHSRDSVIAIASADPRRGMGTALRRAGVDDLVVLADSAEAAVAAIRQGARGGPAR